MADVTLPASPPGQNATLPAGALARPGMSRKASSDNGVRFVDTPSALRRPTFVHRDTNASVVTIKTIDTVISNIYPPGQLLPAPVRPHQAPRGRLLGMRTAYKPLWLLGAGSAGNIAYSLGAVALERGMWPVRPAADVPLDEAVLEPLFGSRAASLGVGATAVALGMGVAATACVLFFQDARRLVRRQNTSNPSYVRPNAYFAAHMAAIVLSVGSKFMAEAVRDTLPRDYSWVAATFGSVGQAMFAVTQAQAFSSCELQNGAMPLQWRAQLGFAARFCMGFHVLFGAMQATPQMTAYGKEAVRLFSITAAALAYSLPLTTARISRQQNINQPIFLNDGPQPSWYALLVLALYFGGSILSGFGPDILQRAVASAGQEISSSGPDKHAAAVYGGACMLATGAGACSVALMLYCSDTAHYNRRAAQVLGCLGLLALAANAAYRGLAEYGWAADMQNIAWLAVPPGVVATGLRLAVVPELFCFSEMLHGELPLRGRYHWKEATRALAQLCFGLWGAMCVNAKDHPVLRESLVIAACTFATIGTALPTATSRRSLPKYAWPLSPAATLPSNQDDGFPWNHTTRAASDSVLCTGTVAASA